MSIDPEHSRSMTVYMGLHIFDHVSVNWLKLHYPEMFINRVFYVPGLLFTMICTTYEGQNF
ncbi:MAG: hypothetical protein RQ982_09805, partial [Gammaproteobacteria bacterium]|nr:hypothetical protein [Gammaproteobacteria bacterium]